MYNQINIVGTEENGSFTFVDNYPYPINKKMVSLPPLFLLICFFFLQGR